MKCEKCGHETTPKITRYVLEGEWSGYKSSQQRIVHRELLSPKQAKKLQDNLDYIQYTDGTTLTLTVRPAKPREKIQVIKSYCDLICRALNRSIEKQSNHVTVAELN